MKYNQIQNAIIKGFNSNIQKSKGLNIQIVGGTYSKVQVSVVGAIQFNSIEEKKNFNIENYDFNMCGIFETSYLNDKIVSNMSLFDIIDYVASFGGYIGVGDSEYMREFEIATDLDKISNDEE